MPPPVPAARRQQPDSLQHVRELMPADAERTPTSAHTWLLRQLAMGDAVLTDGQSFSLRSGKRLGQPTAPAVIKNGWATVPAGACPLWGEGPIEGRITDLGQTALARAD